MLLELSLLLSLVSGCNSKNENSVRVGYVGTSKIVYEEDKLSGSISYNNIEQNYLRMLMEFDQTHIGGRGPNYWTLKYTELTSGVTMIEYHLKDGYEEDEKPTIIIGNDLEIVYEQSYFDYILQNNWIQNEYDINELMNFFNEKIKPELMENENIKKLNK